jgi:hypothetical protein
MAVSYSRRLVLSRVPGAAQREAKRNGALQTRDRRSLWRSRISGAPLHFVTRCTASGTHDSSFVVRIERSEMREPSAPDFASLNPRYYLSYHLQQHALHRSRGAFLRPGFASLLRQPESRGGRSAERRSGARRNTRGACT